MKKTSFGLIGYPISRSFSRPYFTEFFAKNGLADTHEYLNFEMKSVEGFKDLPAKYPGLRGCNVTQPHKKNIIPLLDRLDDFAANIGAVNCIRFEADGSSTGFNTDCLGFRDDLLAGLKQYKWAGSDDEKALAKKLQATNALVLGTGGASLAVIQALKSLGVTTTSVSRSAGPDRITYQDLNPEVLQNHLLIVNTTPLGMTPNVDTCPDLPYAAISDKHFAYDVVYTPEESLFLKKFAANGAGIRNGLGMLYAQAAAGWAIWSEE